MNSSSVFLLTWMLLIAICQINATRELLLLSVATDETDGYKRYIRSVSANGLETKVLGLGIEWMGGDLLMAAGGGQKVNFLKEEMEKHKHKKDLVILFTDSYDVVITGGKDEILKKFDSFNAKIVFGAENFCWPDISLETVYPRVRHGYKFLNSGGFIGFAPDIYELVSDEIHNRDDDQLYFTKIFLDQNRRENLGMVLDTQAQIFQNIQGNEEDLSLVFEEDDTRLSNTVYQTTPTVIHGNGNSKTLLNSVGNYLAKSWTASEGCISCSENNIVFNKDDKYPKVLMGVFIHKPTPFLEEMLQKALNITYDRKRISLFVHNMLDVHEATISSWVEEQRKNKMWTSIKYISSSDLVKEWHTKNMAIDECLSSSCDIYFSVDSEVHLDNPETLKLLISYNRPVVGAIMTRIGKAWSSFWGAVTDTGFYARSTDYLDIVYNKRRGIWNVPHIYGAYVIKRSVMENVNTKPNYIFYLADSDMAMVANMRMKNTFMFAANLETYGHLVNTDAVSTKNLHNDLWQVAANPEDWENRYLHPDYYEAAKLETKNEAPCPDVYWFPIFTPRFCKDFIEQMDSTEKWSTGKNNDPRLSGGYENVPTVDIHMNQVEFDQEWLFIIKKYIKPLSEKTYTGYTSDAKSHLNFIVRYKPSEQSFLRPHHDSSTYTINVALNRVGIDYEGGGSHFIRYNCSVQNTRIGWTIMHPGRLTHYHEGLETTKGTRYIMVSFIDA